MEHDEWIDAAMGEPEPRRAWLYAAAVIVTALLWGLILIGAWTLAGWLL